MLRWIHQWYSCPTYVFFLPAVKPQSLFMDLFPELHPAYSSITLFCFLSQIGALLSSFEDCFILIHVWLGFP